MDSTEEQELNDLIVEFNEEALTADGFHEAIIGMAERPNLSPVVAYSVEKVIEILMPQMEVDESELEEGDTIEGMKYQMAYEYFEFNIKSAWMGDHTPVFITKLEE